MPTVVERTIGTGGDYSSMSAWEADAPANLVSADQVWQGQLLNQTFTLTGSGTALTMDGSTSDSTRYKELTCAAGASFKDNANKLTNPLRCSASHGALVRSETITYGNPIMRLTEGFARIRGLQIYHDSKGQGRSSMCVERGRVYDCILQSYAYESSGVRSVASLLVEAVNTVFCMLNGTTNAAICSNTQACTYINCTFVRPSDLGNVDRAVRTNYTPTLQFTNCAFFGCADLITSLTNVTFTNCRGNTVTNTPSSGYTAIDYSTSTGAMFENISESGLTFDWRIKSGSGLIDVGTAAGGAASADIVGTSRPQGSAYDVGAWEFSSGGGGSASLLPRRGGASFSNLFAL